MIKKFKTILLDRHHISSIIMVHLFTETVSNRHAMSLILNSFKEHIQHYIYLYYNFNYSNKTFHNTENSIAAPSIGRLYQQHKVNKHSLAKIADSQLDVINNKYPVMPTFAFTRKCIKH